MKKLLIIAAMALLAGCGGRPQTIEYPVRGRVSDNYFEIYEAISTDTVLTLKGNIYNRPNYWVSISENCVLKGNTTGKEYRLLGVDGITLGKKEYMPENGTMEFAFHFEPVSPDEESADLVNDEFTVTDIALKKSRNRSKYTCIIDGTVEDPAYSRMILMPYGEDFRVAEFISIPVKDGKFHYELHTDEVAAYEIIPYAELLQGRWWSTTLFSEDCSMNVKFFSFDEDQQPETESDGELNNEYAQFKEQQQAMRDEVSSVFDEREAQLEAENKIYLPQMAALIEESQKATSDEQKRAVSVKINQLFDADAVYTDEYKEFRNERDKKYMKVLDLKYKYYTENISEVGLLLLREDLQRIISALKYDRSILGDVTLEDVTDAYYNLYADRFSTTMMGYSTEQIIVCSKMAKGTKYIDFTAPDLDGNQHTLSQEIDGRIALIDLWASWCGPCRRTSQSMIPVYEKYSARGFVIVGVARERSAEAMKAALEADGYPWLNLLELNDANRIWYHYGVGNGGGSTFLVDKDGSILAINPTAEEVTALLEEKL